MLARPRSLAASLAAAAVSLALLALPGPATADPALASGEAAGVRSETPADEAPAQSLGDGRGLTLDLLDQALAQSSSPASARTGAHRVFARPTDAPDAGGELTYQTGASVTQSCQDGVCVHWARATSDAPALGDGNDNGRPDYVDRVFSTLLEVRDTYEAAGYRRPIPDGTLGGGGADKFDVYLLDTGRRLGGVYGYCVPETFVGRGAQAYCALDNDFAEFPLNTPQENLQVTVAHEYFHAVQFAYDAREDRWLLEATATWAEDEMYDAVNDNLQYLAESPLSQPRVSIDRGVSPRYYGSWIFFRYLSETERAAKGGLPTIVRDIVRAAAGRKSSLQAIEAVLTDRKRSLTSTVAKFAAANRHPSLTYDEGKSYPVARPVDTVSADLGDELGGGMTLGHLASGTFRIKPGARTAGKSTKLRVAVDLPSKSVPTAAAVTVRQKSGAVKTKLVRIDKTGAGVLRVPFSSAKVAYVDVTLVNASDRFRCNQGTVYSCQGKSKDDNRRLEVRVRAQR